MPALEAAGAAWPTKPRLRPIDPQCGCHCHSVQAAESPVAQAKRAPVYSGLPGFGGQPQSQSMLLCALTNHSLMHHPNAKPGSLVPSGAALKWITKPAVCAAHPRRRPVRAGGVPVWQGGARHLHTRLQPHRWASPLSAATPLRSGCLWGLRLWLSWQSGLATGGCGPRSVSVCEQTWFCLAGLNLCRAYARAAAYFHLAECQAFK
jgi:hypothetical protein